MRKLLAVIFLMSAIPLSAEVYSINKFGGLNTDDSPLTLTEGQTPDSENVVTDDGPGIKGRLGEIRYSTESSTGLWEFPMSNGTRYLITKSSNTLKATTNGTFSVVVSTVPTDRDLGVAVLGDKLFFCDSLNGLKYWDGSSVTTSSKTLTFTMLATYKGRLAGAGRSGYERIVWLSKYLDGTNWTLVTNPSDDDPVQITVSGSLDENIQAIFSSFQDKLIWFKKNSFGFISGSRRSNFVQRTLSDSIGIASVETIQDCDGRLRWLGNNRTIYEFDGASFKIISSDIDALLSTIQQGDASNLSVTQTTQADFDAGAGTGTTTGNPSGTVSLSTQVFPSLTDTSQSNFDGGTYASVRGDLSAGSLYLGLATKTNREACGLLSGTTPNATCTNCAYYWRSFTSTSSYWVDNMSVRLVKPSGVLDTQIIFYSDNGTKPGTLIGRLVGQVVGSGSAQTVVFSTHSSYGTFHINSGTRYWWQFASDQTAYPIGTSPDCASSEYHYETNSAAIPSSGFSSDGDYIYQLSGSPYQASGSFISRAFDVATTTNTYLWSWSTFTVTTTIPSNTTLSWETQTASATTGTWDSLVSVTAGNSPTSTVRRFIRYKAALQTTDTSLSPIIDDVTINGTQLRRATGTFVSDVFDLGTAITSLGVVSMSDTQNAGTIQYQFQTSTNSSIDLFLSTNWVTVTNGGIPTQNVARYAAFRTTFTATNATGTLAISDLTVNFTEGSTIRASSGYVSERYWLGLAISSTSNNRVLVYDKDDEWQRYSGLIPEYMGRYRSRLYIGNTSGIFLTESGYSDNGAAINSYYTTPTVAPSGIDYFAKYKELRLTTDNSDNTLTPTFQIDETGTNNTFGSVAMNQTSGYQNLKFPFSTDDVQQGKFISLKLSSSGSSFWRLLNANLYFDRTEVPD